MVCSYSYFMSNMVRIDSYSIASLQLLVTMLFDFTPSHDLRVDAEVLDLAVHRPHSRSPWSFGWREFQGYQGRQASPELAEFPEGHAHESCLGRASSSLVGRFFLAPGFGGGA